MKHQAFSITAAIALALLTLPAPAQSTSCQGENVHFAGPWYGNCQSSSGGKFCTMRATLPGGHAIGFFYSSSGPQIALRSPRLNASSGDLVNCSGTPAHFPMPLVDSAPVLAWMPMERSTQGSSTVCSAGS
jgi:hypothetical protein